MNTIIFPRTIKSFVKRHRKLTPHQATIFDAAWKRFGVDVPASDFLDLNANFGRSAPKIAEIGFGHGDTLLSMSIANPQCDYVGIEVHAPGVAAVLTEITQKNTTNVRVIQHDAVDVLEKHIPDETFSRIHIYFPDPWHKKKHHKRRMIQPPFVELLVRKLAVGGIIHSATDWENYAQHMMRVLSAAPGLVNVIGENQFADNAALQLRVNTKFEKRGVRLGHAVWDLLFMKKT